MTLASGLLLLTVCLLVEAFFSGSEIALVNADRMQLQLRAERGVAGAARAVRLLEDEASLLGTCLIGTNLSVVTGSAVTANLVMATWGAEGGLAALAYVPFALVLGEALPKTVFQHHADRIVDVVAAPLWMARAAFVPFLFVVRAWGRFLAYFAGTSPGGYLTRQELLELLEDHNEGPIAPEERRLIRGVLELRTTTVFDAMTPLVQVVGVHEESTIGSVVDLAARTAHSRLPVFRGRVDNIVGMVHQGDLLFLDNDREPLAPHVRPVRFVPEQKSARELFTEMRTEGDHFAVVVDEYGGCVGIVTLEDLLEQLVGDIEDERDTPEARIVQGPDGSWRVPAQTEIDVASAAFGVSLPDDGPYETLAGLLLHRLGRIPIRGESCDVAGLRIVVEQATERAILLLTVRECPPEQDAEARSA